MPPGFATVDEKPGTRNFLPEISEVRFMYAIVNIAGVQMRATPEGVLDVPKLAAEPGATVTFDQVMLLADGDKITVGRPLVAKAAITAVVLEHRRGPKVVIGKFKRRKDYRLRKGHRQDFTRVRVTQIAV